MIRILTTKHEMNNEQVIQALGQQLHQSAIPKSMHSMPQHIGGR